MITMFSLGENSKDHIYYGMPFIFIVVSVFPQRSPVNRLLAIGISKHLQKLIGFVP